ncbi:MAG: HAD-IIIA family hydrolase [Phycisphaeraceae bacterium]|nr:HAD-IIIA family hydrolase [Phycisphaerales bacterium]MCB9861177.1 HAD-IIIA family hydrolase [Phycisphaeraceae bacterium]
MAVTPSGALPRHIKLLVLDVDGVLTDGSILYGMRGEQYQRFHVRDGYGIKQWINKGLYVGIISGRSCNATITRLQELGITHMHLGVSEPKDRVLSRLMSSLGVAPDNVAVMGDDVPDLPMFTLAGYSIAPADAEPTVLKEADIVTTRTGGNGAVREAIDHLLASIQ